MTGIASFLVLMIGPLARKVLLALGFGFVSYAAVSTALTAALNAAKASLNGITVDVMNILSLGGVFTAMSIIAGAMITRVGMQALKRLEVLK